MNKYVRYIRKEFDNVLIVSTLAKIAYENSIPLDEKEFYILSALKRANPGLDDKSIDEIGEYIQSMNDVQIAGLSNNVKGILHEIQFVEIENSDGDSVTAAMFADTNHEGMDVILTDNTTGEITEVQLKATDNTSYVQEWFDKHDGEILVTTELAEKMNLETTGISNQELTTNVDDFVSKLIDLDDSDELWDYIPELPAISIALAAYFLIQKYNNGEIPKNTLKTKLLKLTGIKFAKFTLIAGLMMIPVVNVVVGATLVFKLLYGAGSLAKKYVP